MILHHSSEMWAGLRVTIVLRTPFPKYALSVFHSNAVKYFILQTVKEANLVLSFPSPTCRGAERWVEPGGKRFEAVDRDVKTEDGLRADRGRYS